MRGLRHKWMILDAANRRLAEETLLAAQAIEFRWTNQFAQEAIIEMAFEAVS